MEIGNKKDLVCSCGLLTRFCSTLIRFGAAVSNSCMILIGVHEMHGQMHPIVLASSKRLL